MSNKYPGGLVTLNPPVQDPALGAATPGIWTLDQALNAEVTRSWPMYDPYYKNVVLNLHGEGTNGAQNNTFLDSSTNNFTITRNGNTTQGSFSPYGNGWSNYYSNSTSVYSQINTTTVFNFGTSDFTIEFWFNITPGAATNGGYGRAMMLTPFEANLSSMFQFRLTGSSQGSSGMYMSISGGAAITYSNPVSQGVWHHTALTRSGTTLRFFLDGVLSGTATDSTNVAGNQPITVGAYKAIDPTYDDCFAGYISNMRVTKSAALYTSTFVPPTAPLTTTVSSGSVSLLTFQNNRVVDNSATAAAISQAGSPSVQRFSPFLFNTSYTPSTIGGSGYFDGTGDFLTVAAGTTALAYGTGDFDITFWCYINSLISTAAVFYDQRGSGGTDIAPLILVNVTTWRYAVAGTVRITGSAPVLNQWNFVQVSRSSGTTRMWVNGVQQGSDYTDSNNYVCPTGFPKIGGYSDDPGVSKFNGYMTDLKILKGTGYSSATTVPTAPASTTSTALCLSYTNAGIYDNAMMNDLETVGNAQISTSVKKYGTGSMSFPTTGDYLTTLATSNLSFGTGDFTVEGWMYFNTVGTDMTIFTGTTNGNISIRIVSSQIRVGTLGVSWDTSSATQSFSTATWYHFAVVRSSGTITFYLNGTSIGSGANTNAYNVSAGATIAQAGGSAHLDGYLDDLRITKGVARYVANFTPPTSQLQDQ